MVLFVWATATFVRQPFPLNADYHEPIRLFHLCTDEFACRCPAPDARPGQSGGGLGTSAGLHAAQRQPHACALRDGDQPAEPLRHHQCRQRLLHPPSPTRRHAGVLGSELATGRVRGARLLPVGAAGHPGGAHHPHLPTRRSGGAALHRKTVQERPAGPATA